MEKFTRTAFNAALRESYHANRRLGFFHTASALAEMIADDERVARAVPEAACDAARPGGVARLAYDADQSGGVAGGVVWPATED